jgi:hypothetical protein
METRSLRERFMLEGAIGYIAHLSQSIQEGKLKTLYQISTKLDKDGKSACGALSLHLENALKAAGFETGLLEETTNENEESEEVTQHDN